MRKLFPILALVLATFGTLRAGAQALTADEKTFIDKHISDIVTTQTTRVTDAAVTKVFATPFYKIRLTTDEGGGGSSYSDFIAARINDKLVYVSPPGTDGDVPELLKMLDPKFKLAADADATALQQAFDVLYPPFGDDDKKAIKFTHAGNQWTFIRGKFFDSQSGYVITTDANGTITAVKYTLKLP